MSPFTYFLTSQHNHKKLNKLERYLADNTDKNLRDFSTRHKKNTSRR